jgi:diguanylate cyclase (GGDEF)-like protein
MSFITSVDVNTLIGCQIALTLVYAIVFCCMKSMYPYLRGTGHVALAFFVASIANTLLLLSGFIPPFLSTVVAHGLLLSAFVLFYDAVLHFFKSPRKIRYVWLFAGLASALMIYLAMTHTHNRALTYIIAISFFLVRGVIAIEVSDYAAGRIFLRIFAYLMGAYAIFALNRLIFLLVYGVEPNLTQRNVLQIISVLLSVSFVFLIGLSFLLMLCSDLLTLVKDESERDLLSGVLNRRGIEQKLAAELNRTSRTGQGLSIALVDVDHFKTINDYFGHAAGDMALRDVVAAISERLRSHDFVGRFGGDEFLLVFPRTSCADALAVSGRIEQSVRQLSVRGAEMPLTISIGLTQAIPGEVGGPLLARADKALYNAKNAGRNCCRVLLHEEDAEVESGRIVLTSIQSDPLPR